jgi:pimeloyl-ACP methyl ester carboxylesterase
MTDAGTLDVRRGGEGEPLVLIHGLGSSRRVWDRLRPRLEAKHEVIAFDLPGFGESPWPGERAGIPHLADAVEAELDGLGIERAHVAGHSMGGWTAAELAVRGRARSATLIDPVGLSTPQEKRWRLARLRATRKGAELLAPLGATPFRPAPLRALLTLGMRTRGWRQSPETLAEEARFYAHCPAFHDSLAWMHEHDAEGIEHIACQVQVVWGTWDLVVPFRQAKRWVAIVPGAELLALERTGHDPITDRPEETAEAILGCTARAA